MTRRFTVRCLSCTKQFDRRYSPFCDCGGITDVLYDLGAVALHDSPNPYHRFQDLLPVHDASLLPTDATFTPLHHARRLGGELGLERLHLKNETLLPTGTTKDRMAAVSLAYLFECGVRSFCTSSTGNSSTAYAHVLERFPELSMFLFTASDFRHRVQYRQNPRIVHYVMRDATFTEAFDHSGRFARANGFVSERGFFNLGRREGLKMAMLEAAEQASGPIDWYVQAVSSAMGVYGTWKAARELYALGRIPRLPRLLCVQQESCAPMVRAWEEGSETIQPRHIVRRPSGIANAILRGDPTRVYPIMRKIVAESGGTFVAVSEAEIREARSRVERLEGIDPCFDASAAVAGMIRLAREGRIAAGETIMVNLTGADRDPGSAAADERDVRWLRRQDDAWVPEDPSKESSVVHPSGDN
jgi:threonine synthase